MIVYIQRAIKDLLENRFLNAVTIITIALSVLIVSAFGLFFFNLQDMFNAWKKGVRIMVYLAPDTTEAQCLDTRSQLQSIDGIERIRFVSKDEAMRLMKERMPHQASLLDHLKENPLPDAFDVALVGESNSPEKIAFLAQRIEGLPAVAEVEYGQQWIERFGGFFNLFKLAGYGLGTMFFMATVFIAANTIRLVLYSRREEIQIMRLVGAADRFIRVPYYLEGMIQGLSGSLIGLGLLYAAFTAIGSQFQQTLSTEMVSIRFLSMEICAWIVGAGLTTGLLGSFFSLKQFMKR
ncbi:cell division protein FtsX [Desulfosarcina ovata subsp. sediminis]|uniref:Cell division protein FtsX n=1 Tax=Desulfosarcina ovata subsp. sediminis TaxID=885957 RepID=A0A5K7ZTF3_9BACT|nr:permease-like cell division protein FtsX [Desulfosarcina ovata]BBO83516.1 cell division protein FtsX [Desulfosarcina ovata subsp. sediminis]